MILSCNSCGKKFVVPDNAITEAGRLVQCSACGNKWKQFPIKVVEEKEEILTPLKKQTIAKPISPKKSVSPKKSKSTKKKGTKKKREINLYSPEYLAKKHGIKIRDSSPKNTEKNAIKEKVTFGFYSSLLVFLVLIIFFSRTLYFIQTFVITLFPAAEFYLSYYFENLRNLFEIWKSLITYY